jgi:hypothetical protein
VGSSYISWWPSATVSALDGVRTSVQHTADDDLVAEGRPPHHRIVLNGLDERAIEAWWRTFRVRSQYRLFLQNCSTVVAMALKAGGATQYTSGWDYMWNSWNTVWHPNDVRRYAEAVRDGLARSRR